MWRGSITFFMLVVCLLVAQTQSLLKDSSSLYSYRGKLWSNSRFSLLARQEDSVNDFEEDDDPPKTSNSAEMQWLITSKMRNVLVNELGYLESEVDDMEPQIASVVINRSLARPAKGMPDSWRRSSIDKASSSPLQRWKQQFTETFQRIWNQSKEFILPVLPALFASSILWYQKDTILLAFSTLWNSIRSIRIGGNDREITKFEDYDNKPRKWFGLFRRGSKDDDIMHSIKFPKVKANKVDILSLEGVSKMSLWDRLALRFKRE